MKKFIFSSFILASALLFCAFSPNITQTIQVKSLRVLLSTVANTWSQMVSNTDLSYEAIDSWLPERGVRGRYAVVKQVMSKQVIEGIVGKKAFLGGPHMDEMDFAHGNFGQTFTHDYAGRYNPAFLTGLNSILQETLADKAFTFDFQAFYNQELKRYLQTFYLTYGIEKRNDHLFRQAFDIRLSDGTFDEYEAPTCQAFWKRRIQDGTDDEFLALLRTMLEAFDPTFLDSQVSSEDRIQDIRAIYQDYQKTIMKMTPLYEKNEQVEGPEWLTVYGDPNDRTKLVARVELIGSDRREYYFEDSLIAFIFQQGVKRDYNRTYNNSKPFEKRIYFHEGKIIKLLNKSSKKRDPDFSRIPNQEQDLSHETQELRKLKQALDKDLSFLKGVMKDLGLFVDE